MTTVITYGTYDLLHEGHRRLLERAKTLGDYLIVGVTSEGFDRARGKINVRQSLMDRIAAVEATGLADKVIVEEYEGQKIDDIRRYDVDIFTVGSDWEGHFDYLREYCRVVYLPRTEGISSSMLRSDKAKLRLGVIGDGRCVEKVVEQAGFVNGLEMAGRLDPTADPGYRGLEALLDESDAVFIRALPEDHERLAAAALRAGKHVLCESPSALGAEGHAGLCRLADEAGVTFVDAVKTSYALAYSRLLLLVKGGAVGEVVSVDATCTSLADADFASGWGSMAAWGPTTLLPIFQILGTGYLEKRIWAVGGEPGSERETFVSANFTYPRAVATMRVGKGVKSEGELVVTGTKGCVYVPAPWWKTDYFEVHYEDASKNRRFFYQLEGEGIRYELASFAKTVEKGGECPYAPRVLAGAIAGVMGDFVAGVDVTLGAAAPCEVNDGD